jgi:polar amino acid transport system substrate-binding protein
MMPFFMKSILVFILLNTFIYAVNTSIIHLLVENKIDEEIAQDIKRVSKNSMNIDIYTSNHLDIITKVLTDPNAQFAIVSHDVLLYKRDIERVENFEKKIKMILPLYDKTIYILVRKGDNFRNILDLKGKRVNLSIGKNEFSTLGRLIKKKHRISWKESHYTTTEAMTRLLNNEVDAVIFAEAKPSDSLKSLSIKDISGLTFLSPKLGKAYDSSVIDRYDYSWLDKDIQTNMLHTVLISYNYQESKSIQRFTDYVKNISTIINTIGKNNLSLKEVGHSYWKKISPYAYRKVPWSVHTKARTAIYTNMDKLNRFTNTIGMEFIGLPRGEFMMGSIDNHLPLDEQPQHKQKINSFYMLKYEVTQNTWKKVMKTNPSVFNSQRLKVYTGLHPVENISFKDAKRFVEKLNFLEGRSQYRLPTEAEWEYASEDTRPIKLQDKAWYVDNANNHTQRVGKKKANKWGLYDMQGNVWEWCDSYYSKTYTLGEKDKNLRILRGGSFVNLATNTRQQNRMANTETIKRFNNGLRLVYDKSISSKPYQNYTVKYGDTLSTIASIFYHNSKRWDIIYYANKESIGKNPSNISVASKIRIPSMQVIAFEERNIQTEVSDNAIKLLSGTDFQPFLGQSLPNGGMANDIVHEIFETIKDKDYKIFWNNDFSTHFSLLENASMDVGIAWYKPDCKQSNLGKDAKRRCEFKFSKAIFEVISTLYKRSDNKINPLVAKDIYLSKVCRPKGIYTFDLERQGLEDGKSITLVRPDTKEDCFRLLLENKVDFVAIDKFAGEAIVQKMHISKSVSSLETISTLLGMHLIVHRSNPRVDTIINKLNTGISQLKSNGILRKIQSNHLNRFFGSID